MVLAMKVFIVSVEYVHVHVCVCGFGRRDGAHLSFWEGKSTAQQVAVRQEGKNPRPVLLPFSILLTITHPTKCCYSQHNGEVPECFPLYLILSGFFVYIHPIADAIELLLLPCRYHRLST